MQDETPAPPAREKLLQTGYETAFGFSLNAAEAARYNYLTLEIARHGPHNRELVEAMRDERHKIISGFFRRWKPVPGVL